MISDTIELLAPAGGFEQLEAAICSGADSIYFGVGEMNMRAGAAVNFTLDNLSEVVHRCHSRNIKAYLTVNTVVYDEEIQELYALCDAAKAAGVDACIAGDMAVIQYLRKIGMSVHMTVQCNICNMEAVRFYAGFADVMVLARELPLESIQSIVEQVHQENLCGPSGEKIRLELFIHGALCVAISGKCYMSLSTYGQSANRGKCLQNCRRRYRVFDDTNGGAELAIDNHYIMSPKDLCTIDFLDRILASGVSVLKIEGRGRGADYVATTVSVYREAIDACLNGTFSKKNICVWKERLREVFNRDFWTGGYYLGKKLGEWCETDGNQSTLLKRYVGKINNYFSKLAVAEIKVEALPLHMGDRILITGNTTGALDMTIGELRLDDKKAQEAIPGTFASFSVERKVRTGDKVYLLEKRNGRER